MRERLHSLIERIGRRPLAITLAAVLFGGMLALCGFAVYWFDLSLAGFGQGRMPPVPTPVVWPALPAPSVAHSNWSSFTFANTFRALAFRDRFLFAATDGGVVAFDLGSPNAAPVKYTAEHGLAANRVLSAAASPDGTLWFGTENGLSHFDGTNWVTYTTRDGLPSNVVRDLAFADDGLLWAATPDGLARFDGSRWRTYTKANTLFRLNSHNIRAVATGPTGVWAATAQGIAFFDGRNWSTFTYEEGLANDDARDLAVAPDGSLWVATRAGLSRFDGTAWTRFTTAEGLLENDLHDVTVPPDGSVWVAYGGAAEGLSRYDGLNWDHFNRGDGLANDTVLSLAVSPTGEVWAGTANGLSGFDGAGWRALDGPSELPSNDLRGLVATRGAVWAATGGGISRYDGAQWRLFTTGDGLPANDVRALALGPDDTPWAANDTPSLGASRLGPTADAWEAVPCLTAPPSANVQAGMAGTDGSVWFATDQGVSRYDGTSWKTFTTRDGLPINAATALALAPDGSVWAATQAGLSVFRDDHWSTVTPEPVGLMAIDPPGTLWAVTSAGLTHLQDRELVAVSDAPPGRIRSLVAREDGLWLATYRGISHLREGAWRHYSTEDGLASNDVTQLTSGADGQLWAGFADASLDFAFFEGGRWRSYPEEIVDDAVTSIHALDDGTVWVGTMGGISRYDGQDWQSFEAADGLPANRVYSVAYAYDSIWVATPAGVGRFDGQVWQTFSQRDGLVSNQARELAVAPDGRLWVGFNTMGDGMSVFDGREWQTAAPWEHDAILYTMTFSADGRLWASGRFNSPYVGGSTGFLAVHDGEDWAWRPILPDWPFGGNRIEAAPDRRMWVAIDGNRGLQVLDVSADDLGREVAYYSESIYAYPLAIGADGRVWASTNYRTKIMAFDGRDWTIEPIPLSAIVSTLELAPDGSLWVGTNRGAAHYDGDSWRTLRTAASLYGFVEGSVQALTVTRDGTVWFGTESGLVKRYSPDHVRLSTYPAALTLSEATSLFTADDGALWVATAGSGIARFDGSKWQVFTPDALLGTTLVHTLAVNAEGSAWLGTTSGMVHLEDNNCGFEEGLRQRANVLTAESGSEGMWIGTQSSGAMLLSADGTLILEAESFTGTPVTALDAAEDGSAWFAGPEEVFSYAAGAWDSIRVAAELAGSGINAIVYTPDRTLWIGTPNGAAFWDGRRWQVSTTADGLADNSVQYVLAAPDGSLWFATPGGLSRYYP